MNRASFLPVALVLCGFLSLSCCCARPRAVLIGIGTYPTKNWALKSPGNDLQLVSDVLKRWSVPNLVTKRLVNSQATKQHILDGFRAAVADVGKGELLFIYFSGHGTLVADMYGPARFRGDEMRREPPDFDDEALVAYDSCTGDPMSFVLDDEIGEALQPAEKRGAKIVCIFDCCYSAGGLKGGVSLGAAKSINANCGKAKGAKAPPPPTRRRPTTTDLQGPLLLAAGGPRQSVQEMYWPIARTRVAFSPLSLGLWRWASEAHGWRDLAAKFQGWFRQRDLGWVPSSQGSAPWMTCRAPGLSGFTLTDLDNHTVTVSRRILSALR